jgi:hypothetical protein
MRLAVIPAARERILEVDRGMEEGIEIREKGTAIGK